MQNSVWYDKEADRFYYTGKQTEDLTPITLCYHIGYGCNLACDYCLSQNNAQQKTETDLRDFIGYIKQWRPLRLVISGGEPLMYLDRLAAILGKLKDNGIHTFLSTNGTLIRDAYPKLRGFVDWYDISLPATTPETYKVVRGVDKFHEILDGIHLLIKNKERVRLTFTINKANEKELPDFPDFAIKLGVDNIRIGHTYSYVNGALEEKLWKDEYADIISRYGKRMRIYLPLSETQLALYNEGYILLENDGSVYRSMVCDENYVCHISEIEHFMPEFENIAKRQIALFAEERNDRTTKAL